MHMSLIPLTDAEAIHRSFTTALTNLQKHSHPISRKVGWHGGGGEFSIYWRPTEGFWFLIDEVREESRYWLCFGLQDPNQINNLTIVAEINPTKSGINRRNAGFFVQDRQNKIYLAHSGKVGGGRKGIGRSTFLQNYVGRNVESIEWPDGIESTAVVIGRIDSERLPLYVSHFLSEVYRYKGMVSTDEGAVSRFDHVGEPSEVEPELSYTPEFVGHRKAYVVAHEIEAKCDHGVVVKALAEILAGRQTAFGNNQQCDLLIMSNSKRVTHLLEVKTDRSSTNLYTGIGQLMLNGIRFFQPPLLILVVPGEINPKLKMAINRLNVRLVSFEWHERRPVFRGLDEALTSETQSGR
jgi:hypothetical protein